MSCVVAYLKNEERSVRKRNNLMHRLSRGLVEADDPDVDHILPYVYTPVTSQLLVVVSQKITQK